MDRDKGFSLLEVLAVVTIIAIIALCAAPSFGSYRRRASVVSQANELREIFRAVRSRAIARSSHAGVKFVRSGDQWTYALYDDGDGDGIRTDDINSGVDPRYAGPNVLTQFHLAAIALLPYPIRDPDGDPVTLTSVTQGVHGRVVIDPISGTTTVLPVSLGRFSAMELFQ